MATNLRYGSSGEDVRTLQKQLNEQGYNLQEDGQFGARTRAAVTDYQSKNALTVDGIVGDETQGSLTKRSTGTGVAGGPASPEGTAVGQEDAQAAAAPASEVTGTTQVDEALEALNSQTAKPGTYESKYDQQISDVYNQIMGRGQFQYDMNADPQLQQFTQMYQRLGRLAMKDTMGQAADLTGGYGSSYAQMVGQQAYDAYLQDLNQMVPEFYAMAQDRYDAQTERLYQIYNALQNQENQDYSRWLDQYNNWLTEEQLRQSQENWKAEMDLSKEQWDAEMELTREQWEWQKEQAEKAASGSYSGSSGGYYYPDTTDDDTTDNEEGASKRFGFTSNRNSLVNDTALRAATQEAKQSLNYLNATQKLYAQGVNPYNNSAAVISWAADAGYTPAEATELVQLYKEFWYDMTGTKGNSGRGSGGGVGDIHYVLGM